MTTPDAWRSSLPEWEIGERVQRWAGLEAASSYAGNLALILGWMMAEGRLSTVF